MNTPVRESPPLCVAQLTPVGVGAIACLRLTGDGADQSIAQRFTPVGSAPFVERPLQRLLFGRWRISDGDLHEEVVVTRLAVDAVEIACHGGPAVTSAILADLIALGAVVSAEPSALFDLAPDGDPIAQAALAALAEARTSAAAAVLLDQYQGALRRALHAIEVDLAAGRASEAMTKVEALLAREALGRHLVQPWRVAIVGRPNVGKSRLINALLGYDRAIVHEEAGTTRDVVAAATAFGGWPVELTDTAGVREATDAIESAGVALSLSQLESADLVIVVWDGARSLTDDDRRPLTLRGDALLVVNKSDLPPAFAPPTEAVCVSAATGAGVGELAEAVARRLVAQPPEPGDAAPFTRHQASVLHAAKQALTAGDTVTALAALDRLR